MGAIPVSAGHRQTRRSPVFSPPDKVVLYAKEAMEIISKNDGSMKENISKKSRQQLVLLQIKLWGKPLIGNNFF